MPTPAVTERSQGLSQNEFGGRAGGGQAQPPQQPQASKRNMVIRQAPELFSFQAKGDHVAGMLVSAEPVTVGTPPKRVMQFVFRCVDGKIQKLLGTYDINSKLFPSDVGRYVEITLIGEDRNVGTDKGNAMKLFEVAVMESANQFSDGSPITDADIPF